MDVVDRQVMGRQVMGRQGMNHSFNSFYCRRRAFTLIELVIVIVIISLAAVTSLKAFSLLAGRSSDALIQSRTLDLAQLYLDEILAARFDEASGNGGIPPYVGCRITNDGESREDYDDVDDYNAINNESPALINQSLAAVYSGYLVSVTVSCDNSAGVNSNGAKRIDLYITAVDGSVSRFSAYKGNF